MVSGSVLGKFPGLKTSLKPLGNLTSWRPPGNLQETSWKLTGNLLETSLKPPGNLLETSGEERTHTRRPSLLPNLLTALYLHILVDETMKYKPWQDSLIQGNSSMVS